jgi:hypothetical protein
MVSLLPLQQAESIMPDRISPAMRVYYRQPVGKNRATKPAKSSGMGLPWDSTPAAYHGESHAGRNW